MKAWIIVSEDERVGRRCAILRRWKKDVFLTLFMCDLKENVGSMMMLRFQVVRDGAVGAGDIVDVEASGSNLF